MRRGKERGYEGMNDRIMKVIEEEDERVSERES